MSQDEPKRLTGWELREKLRASNGGQLPPLHKSTQDASSAPDKKNKAGKDKGTLARFTTSHVSLDLSVAAKNSVDPKSEAQISAVMDERWARFKLLGRMGLGDIEVSEIDGPLIEKNISILENSIKKIIATREKEVQEEGGETLDTSAIDLRTGQLLEEVKKLVEIPKDTVDLKRNPDFVDLDEEVLEQLRDYVTVISSMYRPGNPFHNFVHASHVLESIGTLLSHSSNANGQSGPQLSNGNGQGVVTDPWTHFALVYAALIHDVDHAGVPNAQLIKEKAHVAGAYKNKSVAEQNSIELAWNLLMEPCYKELRETIFLAQTELIRFRGLVVTAVMATDIADKELAALRKGRVADLMELADDTASSEVASQKATFVLETLIQVADVSHLMQPFETYRQWNYNLYRELYKAFRSGRADTDPTPTWWKGEFGFFDFYIIPLAKKLEKCGIDKEKSGAYVENAMENRRRWEEEGEALVASYAQENIELYPAPPLSNESTLSKESDLANETDGKQVETPSPNENEPSPKNSKSKTEKKDEKSSSKKKKSDKKEKKKKKSTKKDKTESDDNDSGDEDNDKSNRKRAQSEETMKSEVSVESSPTDQEANDTEIKEKSKSKKKDKKDKKDRKRSKSLGAERRSRDKDKGEDDDKDKEKRRRSRSKSRDRKKKSDRGSDGGDAKSPERARSKSPRRQMKSSRSRSKTRAASREESPSSPKRKSKSKSPTRSRSVTRASSKGRSKSSERKSRKSKSPTRERKSRSLTRKSSRDKSKSPKRSKSLGRRRKKKEEETPVE